MTFNLNSHFFVHWQPVSKMHFQAKLIYIQCEFKNLVCQKTKQNKRQIIMKCAKKNGNYHQPGNLAALNFTAFDFLLKMNKRFLFCFLIYYWHHSGVGAKWQDEIYYDTMVAGLNPLLSSKSDLVLLTVSAFKWLKWLIQCLKNELNLWF